MISQLHPYEPALRGAFSEVSSKCLLSGDLPAGRHGVAICCPMVGSSHTLNRSIEELLRSRHYPAMEQEVATSRGRFRLVERSMGAPRNAGLFFGVEIVTRQSIVNAH
jgi:hypothetical protein